MQRAQILATPRDMRIVFYPKNHIFEVDGKKCPFSLTRFISIWFGKFDPDVIYAKLKVKAKGDIYSKYNKLSKEEVLAEWVKKGTDGTMLHECIEAYFNGDETGDNIMTDPKKKHLIKDWFKFLKYLKVRTEAGFTSSVPEKIIFGTIKRASGEEVHLPGIIDNIAIGKGGHRLLIEDWKRTDNIYWAPNNKELPYPLTNLKASKRIKHELQLTLAYELLHDHYPVKGMSHLLLNVYFHREQSTYKMLPSRNLQKEVRIMIDMIKNPEKYKTRAPKVINEIQRLIDKGKTFN